jgi:hypothetical protein
MKRHVILVAGATAMILLLVSPSLAEHGKLQSVNAKNAERMQRPAATTEAHRVAWRAAIAALCSDNTLSSGQRDCERMARTAADAELRGVKVNH